ncbi:MAG TPA: hypothetical protein VFE62_27375 [Gemmataceae bacterium]|nr:hypothetical protein [Gemmataceae bacterium]
MNRWRWLGLALFVAVGVLMITSARPVVLAQGKTDDKTKTPDKTNGKTPEKTNGKTPEKTDAKAAQKTEEKTKQKTEEKKQTETPKAGGGEKMPFTAFDTKDKSFYQEQKTETIQDMKVQGQAVKQTQKQTFLILWTVKDKKDGNYVVQQQIKGVKMEIDIGGNKIEYDSTKKNAKNPMTDFFEKLTDDKQTLTFHISPKLKVTKIDGREEFIKNLSDINPQMKNLLNAILSDKALQKMAEPTWWAYPPDGVVPADKKWEAKTSLELGPIGTYNTTFDFTYKGDNKIGIKSNLTYTAPAASDKAGLPFVIESATLSSKSGEGEAVYDPKAGRFSSTSLKMDIKGDLKIAVGNQTTTVELTQKQETSSIISDTNPWADKKGN